MAGGIDWFRWHHGSVTDQKFPLVAKRAGASVAEVIAVWACVLEAASMNAERGTLADTPDFESMDCALGLVEGRSLAIFNAMCSRNLIDKHLQIVSWSKRQPKREREDDNSTGRVRAFRDRERHETPRNASDSSETPREEESREEEIPSSLRSEGTARKRAPAAVAPGVLVEAGFSESMAQEFIDHKRRAKAPLTERAWADHCREAGKAGWTVVQAAERVMARGWKGFDAAYVASDRPPARASPKSFAQADSEARAARVYEMTGGLMGKKPATTIEVFDATPTAIR